MITKMCFIFQKVQQVINSTFFTFFFQHIDQWFSHFNIHDYKFMQFNSPNSSLVTHWEIYNHLHNPHILYYTRISPDIPICASCIACFLNLLQFLQMIQKQIIQKHQGYSNLLAVLSHEMKTPLCSIIGTSTLLLKHVEKYPEYTKSFNIIHKCAFILIELINDIIDYVRLNSKQVVYQYNTFSLRDMIEKCMDAVSDKIKAKQLQIQLDIDPTFPEYILHDHSKLTRVIINLLTNAIKYSPEKHPIYIQIHTNSSLNHPSFSIQVRDMGPGIPEKLQSSLFQPFSRFTQDDDLDIYTQPCEQGLGLGLSICKHIVQLYNGNIYLKPNIQPGCCFCVDLPWIQGPLQRINQPVSTITPHILQIPARSKSFIQSYSPLILIVEDNIYNMDTFIRILHFLKYTHIHTAKNGQEAYNMCIKTEYNIIFMDLHMPVMTGITSTQYIRKLPYYKTRGSIIGMTAFLTQNTMEYYKEIGFTDFITKPIEMNLLQKILTNITRQN